jgi:hypothetical protein
MTPRLKEMDLYSEVVNFHGVLQSCSTCSGLSVPSSHSRPSRRRVRPLRPGLSGSATTTINHVACAAGDVMGLMELQCSILPTAYYCTAVNLVSLVAIIHAFGRFIFATEIVQIPRKNPPFFRLHQ